MKIIVHSATTKETLLHLAKANALHVRTGGGQGEIFKTDAATVTALLGLSGSTFTLGTVEIQGQRGKLSNRTNSSGEKYSVATGKTETLCKVTAVCDKDNSTHTFRAKLGEIAACDANGKIVLVCEMVGKKVNETTKEVTDAGQFWIHAEEGATLEQQTAFLEQAVIEVPVLTAG